MKVLNASIAAGSSLIRFDDPCWMTPKKHGLRWKILSASIGPAPKSCCGRPGRSNRKETRLGSPILQCRRATLTASESKPKKKHRLLKCCTNTFECIRTLNLAWKHPLQTSGRAGKDGPASRKSRKWLIDSSNGARTMHETVVSAHAVLAFMFLHIRTQQESLHCRHL